MKTSLHFLIVLTISFAALAQDTLLTVPKPDVTKELAGFTVAEGFEVNLFASDPMIANPTSMHWDDQGRLWVVGSAVYPHIIPGQEARDTITVIEDTDGDGVADKSSVFSDDLFIPTGVAFGDGGVYVANSTELIHLKDTDGDLVADEKRIVLSGFGTEDTHHILHSLRWGYDGFLYMNQSIYIHSHIETPHGPKHLNAGGVWQFRTDTMELDVFTRGLVNSWGHHFDTWGQSFQTDGAGAHGINYVFPGAAFMTAYNMPKVLQGLNPGSPKHSGLEIISGSHFPEDWRGTMVTNDFRGHRVVRFKVDEAQSGYTSVEQPEILTSNHVAFRPVDVKMGPDGALYIADWYNPIIQHGEVDFRDPRRDHEHGRIWRVTKKGSPTVKHPAINDAPIEDLIELTRKPEQWNRTHAKRELIERDRDKVLAALKKSLTDLKPSDPNFENARLELLWTYQTLGVVNESLLNTLLESKDYHVRAAAVRVLSEWKTRLNTESSYLSELTNQATDEHPRVRLEAIRALARVKQPEAIDAAMQAMNPEMDKNIDYALWTLLRESQDAWISEVDDLEFAADNEKLLFALKAIDSHEAVAPLMHAYLNGNLEPKQARATLDAITDHANAKELGVIIEHILGADDQDTNHRAKQLGNIIATSKRRNIHPRGDLSKLSDLIKKAPDALKIASIEAAGQWKLEDQRDTLEKLATKRKTETPIRESAIKALATLGGDSSRDILAKLTASKESLETRVVATHALLALSPEHAAENIIELLNESPDPGALYRAFIKSDEAATALTQALKENTIPAELAKLGKRAISSSGREVPELSTALSIAGNLDEGPDEFTPEQLAKMVAAVNEHGDPQRGFEQFRKLDCFQCHAIAGAGGSLGPDLTSLGGSAQVDYLIESNYFPNKAIKEGYHSLLVETKTGELYSGIKVSETDTELILRNSVSDAIRIPLDSIEIREDGGSLMPTGLGDALLENEFNDLVSFLSELGRTPDYSVGTDRYARTWRTLSDTQATEDYLYETEVEAAAKPHESLTWVQAYSDVNGAMPLKHIPELRHRYWQKSHSFLQFTLESASAGKTAIAIAPQQGTQLWIDGKQIELNKVNLLDLKAGETKGILILDRSIVKQGITVQLINDDRATITPSFKSGR
jgi:putative heme-binding domain-containing protein